MQAAAAAGGMRCRPWLGWDLSNFDPGDAEKEAQLKQVIEMFKVSPGMGLWKGADEPDWGNSHNPKNSTPEQVAHVAQDHPRERPQPPDLARAGPARHGPVAEALPRRLGRRRHRHLPRQLPARRPLGSSPTRRSAWISRADHYHLYQSFSVAVPLLFYAAYRGITFLEADLARIGRALGLSWLPARHMLTLPLLVVLLVTAPVPPLDTVRGLPSRFSSVVSDEPEIERLGYDREDANDVRMIRRVSRSMTSLLDPGEGIFDFSNTPGLFHYIFDLPPSTRYYHVAFAVRRRQQTDLLRQLQKERPEVVVYVSDDYGIPVWDGIANQVRHYDVSEYLLDNYVPVLDTRDFVLMARRDEGVQAVPALYFQMEPCDWGFVPNFFSPRPAPGADTVSVPHRVLEAGRRLEVTLPADSAAYNWLEVRTGRPLVEGRFELTDRVGGDRPSLDRVPDARPGRDERAGEGGRLQPVARLPAGNALSHLERAPGRHRDQARAMTRSSAGVGLRLLAVDVRGSGARIAPVRRPSGRPRRRRRTSSATRRSRTSTSTATSGRTAWPSSSSLSSRSGSTPLLDPGLRAAGDRPRGADPAATRTGGGRPRRVRAAGGARGAGADALRRRRARARGRDRVVERDVARLRLDGASGTARSSARCVARLTARAPRADRRRELAQHVRRSVRRRWRSTPSPSRPT